MVYRTLGGMVSHLLFYQLAGFSISPAEKVIHNRSVYAQTTQPSSDTTDNGLQPSLCLHVFGTGK